MASIYKTLYKRFNGVDWDTYYHASVTSQVASDAASRRYVSDDMLSWIGTYLSGSTDLLGPALAAKAPLSGPSFTNGISVSGPIHSNGILYVEDNITSDDNDFINFTGVSTIGFASAVLEYVGTPTLTHHAVNKAYVDGVVAAGMHPVTYVMAASTQNVDITGPVLTLDGYTLDDNDRVLLKDQTTAMQNGIYYKNTSDLLVRVTADSTQGAYVFVANGENSNDWYFYCQDNVGTWIAQGRPDTVTASGALEKTGVDIAVKSLGITNAMLAGSISNSKIAQFTALDNDAAEYDTWAEITAANSSKSLALHINHLYAAIGLLRGTANYNTNSSHTVENIYTLAVGRNKTYTGQGNPVTTGYITGDIYLQQPA